MAIVQRRQLAEKIIGKALASAVLNKVGFVEAHNSFISENLSSISPSGGTAMRDSIIRGQGLILQLNDEFSLIDAQNNWNFVHIVLTDGDDNKSKATLEEVCAVQLKIGASVPVSRLKTFFVGVDLEKSEQALKEIAVITALGMENSQFISANDAREIENVFEKIKANLGVVQRTELAAVQCTQGAFITGRTTNIPVLTIQKVNYVVLFNLDISGSMAGSRWTQVKQAVNSFVRQLDQDDFVGVIVFSNESKIIDISKQVTSQTPRINLSPLQRQNIQPSPNSQSSQPKPKISEKQAQQQNQTKAQTPKANLSPLQRQNIQPSPNSQSSQPKPKISEKQAQQQNQTKAQTPKANLSPLQRQNIQPSSNSQSSQPKPKISEKKVQQQNKTRAQTPKEKLSPSQRQSIQLNVVPQSTQSQSRDYENPKSKSKPNQKKGCCIIY